MATFNHEAISDYTVKLDALPSIFDLRLRLDALEKELNATKGCLQTDEEEKIFPDEGKKDALARASDIYSKRRLREKIFEPGLFHDPAWDILLDLYVAAGLGKKISIKSACIAAGVPPTTALRWLTVLEQRKLIEKEDDDKDLRRSFVRLSASGIERMDRYLADCRRS